MLQKLSSQQMPWPTDWDSLFGSSHPLILEIGFGYGQYLIHLAQSRPDHHVIGLEVANRCLSATEAAVERLRLPNVRLIHGTAEMALRHLFEPESISEIHVNFPDPWFKHRHGHRRLMQRDTLDVIVSRLTPDGRLFLATDIYEYAAMCADLFAETPGLDNLLDAPWVTSMPERGVITRYEAKALQLGETCHYFALRRTDTPVFLPPVIKDEIMPHIVFENPLTLDDMLARYERSEHVEGDTIIRFMDGYRGRVALLIEVFIKEPTIEQHVAFIILQRDQPGEFTLQLSSLGHARSTVGVHRAAALLGDWLAGLHPDTQILKRKILEENQEK